MMKNISGNELSEFILYYSRPPCFVNICKEERIQLLVLQENGTSFFIDIFKDTLFCLASDLSVTK